MTESRASQNRRRLDGLGGHEEGRRLLRRRR